MEILPTSPSSIQAREANPLSLKPTESITTEKENFSLGQEETELTTTETRKELTTEGQNVLSIKPDFPYSLVAGVTFPIQTQIVPIGATTDEQTGDVKPGGENLSLDPATAFPKPISLGAPHGTSIQLGRPGINGVSRIPNDTDSSISARWQKIGPKVDFTKLPPEFGFQNETLTDAIKNFEVPGFAKEIDLSNCWGGKDLGHLKPGATMLPNAIPQPSVAPHHSSQDGEILAGKTQLSSTASAADVVDWLAQKLSADFASSPAQFQSADVTDWKDQFQSADVANWNAQSQSADITDWKTRFESSDGTNWAKLGPSADNADWSAQAKSADSMNWPADVAFPGQIQPKKLPKNEFAEAIDGTQAVDQVTGEIGTIKFEESQKKLSPIPVPVEEIPTITGVNGQPKKLSQVPIPVIETKQNLLKNGVGPINDLTQAESADIHNWPTDEIVVSKVGSTDEWSWNVDSTDSKLNPLGVDPDANQAVTSISTPKAEIRDSKASGIGDNKNDQRLPENATRRLVEVVADRLEAIAAAKPRNGVTIQLRPLDLGSITMIVKNVGKEVGAELYASHDSVRQALDQNRVMLSQHLEMKGMHLASVTVADSSLSNSTSTFAEQNAQRTLQQNSNQPSTVRFAETDPTVDPNQLLRKGKTDGVDYWI